MAKKYTSKHVILKTSGLYKHSTSGPLVVRQRLATTGQQADPHPLGGTGSVCKGTASETLAAGYH